jgi:hypothetical protein
VADNPPFVLDVDRGTVTRVPAIPAVERRSLKVVGVGGRGAVIVDVRAPGCLIRKACLYAVRGPGIRVVALGTGRNVAAAPGARSLWLQSSSGDSRCVVRQVGLDGRQIRGRRPFPCSWGLEPAGSLGLVVRRNGDRVIDPVTGRTILSSWGVVAAGEEGVLMRCPGRPCAVVDARRPTSRSVPLVNPSGGLHNPAVDPRSRFVAVSFGGPQLLDVWVVDLRTGRRTQVPGMPAYVDLKRTSVEWTRDGQLVLLGETDARGFVAVWRPGEERLRVKAVKLPQRTSGSDSFAVLG